MLDGQAYCRNCGAQSPLVPKSLVIIPFHKALKAGLLFMLCGLLLITLFLLQVISLRLLFGLGMALLILGGVLLYRMKQSTPNILKIVQKRNDAYVGQQFVVCGKCGLKLIEHSNYCSFCGTKIKHELNK